MKIQTPNKILRTTKLKLMIVTFATFCISSVFAQKNNSGFKIDSVQINNEITAYCKYDSISINYHIGNKITWYYLSQRKIGHRMLDKNGNTYISDYVNSDSTKTIKAEFFKSGKLEYYSIKNLKGKRDTAVSYYESGAVKWKSHYNGEVNVTYSYYESGKIKMINYSGELGRPISSKEWCENGTLINEIKESNEVVYNKAFYCNGQIMIEGIFHNMYGLYFGPHKVYYENGKIKREGSFIDATRISQSLKEKRSIKLGQWKYYYENGNIEHLENYNNEGKKEGKCIYYNKIGKIIKTEYYNDDLKVSKKNFKSSNLN